MTRLAFVLSVLAVSTAHAEPMRLAPWRESAALQHVENTRPKLRLERAPHVDRNAHGLDDALAEAITRATHFAGKVAGLRHGIGPFIHVENLVSDTKGVDPPPRVIVIGVQLGGALPISR